VSTQLVNDDAEISPELGELAAAYGVATDYVDQAGAQVRVSRATIEAVLAALGVDTTGPEWISVALRDRQLRDWRRLMPPVFVTRVGQARSTWVHVPHGTEASAWIRTHTGERIDLVQLDVWVEPQLVDGELIGEATFEVPAGLPIGWHTLHAGGAGTEESCPLAVAPDRLNPEAIIGDRQWGLMAQIYSLRSRNSWGIGDLGDVRELATWSGRDLGAGFTLINPLHAAGPTAPMTPSPYLPVTRRYANPIYIAVPDIPEMDRLTDKRRGSLEKLGASFAGVNESSELLDRDSTWTAKRTALKWIFDAGRKNRREREYEQFCVEQGSGLLDFATWCVLVERYGMSTKKWPTKYLDAHSDEVAKFRRKNSADVEFHMWMQWILDEQLAAAQLASRDAGMAIGIIHDLAVGVHPQGADAWSQHSVLANGIGVGAPPDMYNQMGQDWSQPPWRPDALADVAFAPFSNMLRTILRHAGGLRIDHILGLFRMWWVPNGMPAYAGTFVRYDHDALLGILCLEAHLAGAVVIGEDLGTVEPWVQTALAERGILGTSILWFERADGNVLAPEHWRKEALASVTVHDLPPTAGYLRDEHVRIRAELDLLTRPLAVEQAESLSERQQWLELLRQRGMLAWDVDTDSEDGLDQVLIALHRALAAAPSRLLGVAIPDLIGDRRAQNQPGTDQEYPNWRVPLSDAHGNGVLLEDVQQSGPLQDAVIASVQPASG